MTVSLVAMIPARAGSKRVPAKNVRVLGGHPLLAYSIAAARASALFDAVIVSTDDPAIAAIATHYGAEVPFLRPADLAGDTSPDIGWVTHALTELERGGRSIDAFSLLRPTSPFRQPATIIRAWERFSSATGAHSLRAVERCRQHPGKMWALDGDRMRPILSGGPTNPPWHSMPYQALPAVYVQNASLEIAWRRTVAATGTIAGTEIVPFLTQGYEGFDVNDASDWWYAEHLVATGEAVLPAVAAEPWREAMAETR